MELLGKKAPKFKLPISGGGEFTVPTGNPLVLYFYPKDDTPGCTKEAIGFTDVLDGFSKLGVEVVGMSADTLAKHEKFVTKHNLGIRLVSDESKSTLEDYGVWVEKSMYGKTYMGIERATLLIGPDGTVLREWHKVRVKGHVESVLEAARDHFG